MAGIDPHFTVANAIYDCSVICGALFNGNMRADRMADELLDDDLYSYINKSFEEFDEDLKSYSNLTVDNGRIRIEPRQKNNVKAFIQWTRDKIRLGINPDLTRFPVVND